MSVIVNLVIEQGADFSNVIDLANDNGSVMDLTNYTVVAAMRTEYASTTVIPITAVITSPADGEITISLTAVQTTALVARRYVYEVRIQAPVAGVKTRVVEGIITVTPQVAT